MATTILCGLMLLTLAHLRQMGTLEQSNFKSLLHFNITCFVLASKYLPGPWFQLLLLTYQSLAQHGTRQTTCSPSYELLKWASCSGN